jgi:hypothetical protein
VGSVRLVLVGTVSLATLAGGTRSTAAQNPCPPAAAAVHLHQYGPAARADVDADGVRDRAWIAAQPSAPGSCGILLVVRTQRGVATIAVPGQGAGSASSSLRGGLPRLFGLLRLGGSPDLQPVVIVDRGVNAVSFAAYRLQGGRLARLTVPGASGDMLDWADGSSAFGSVDCVGSAATIRVRNAFAEQRGDGMWFVSRHTYRLSDSRFTAEKAFSAVVAAKPKVPAGLPFARCVGLRAGG